MRSRTLAWVKLAFCVVTLILLIVFAFTGDATKPLQPHTLPPAERKESRRAGTGPDRVARIDPNVPVPPLQNKPDITVPYIELWPDAVGVGDTVAVRGMNFCATSVCGPLSIRVDDKVGLDNVAVADDGRFVTYLTASGPQGLQHVTVEQRVKSGQALSDNKVLIVGRPGQGLEEKEAQTEITATTTPGPIVARPDYRPQANPVIITPTAPEAPGAIGFQPNIPWGGRSVAVDIAPNNRDEAIAAAETGGLFRTTDQGATWTHLDNLPVFRMFDVKYASADGNIVIATSAVNSRSANDSGIWRSTDRGHTWSKPATSNPPCADRVNTYGIAVVPALNEAYVGTECGLAISHDQGATWTHVSNWNPGGTPLVYGIAAHHYSGAGSVVDLCGSFGHRRSTDSGMSWTTTNTLPEPYATCPGLGVHAITQSPIDPNVVFIVKDDGPVTCDSHPWYTLAVFESDNGGASWFSRFTPACEASRPPSIVAGNTSTAGQIALYFSNGFSLRQQVCSGSAPDPRCGTVWTVVDVSHSDVNGFAVDPAYNSLLYVVSDGGVHKTSDGGATFPIVGAGNGGYQALQVYEMQDQVHPGLPTDLYFGTQDNSLWSSVDNGANWGGVGPEGFFISLLHNTPTNMGQKINFAACAPCNNNQSGPGWTDPNVQYWPNPPGVGGSPVIVEPNFYLQFTQVNPPTDTTALLNLTLNNGVSWTQVSGVAINEPVVTLPLISGPASNPTVYVGVAKAGGGMGLRKITNVRGAGSAVVTAADTGLVSIGYYAMGQGAYVAALVVGVDPSNPDHLIAADVGTSQMKVSTNGGSSWVDMPELTNLVTGNGKYDFARWGVDGIGGMVQPHFIQWDPANSNRILVSTDEAGVLYSQDGGLSWGRLTGSEKIVNGTTFAFDEVLGRTLAASYGRGLWQLDFTPADISIVKRAPAAFKTQIQYAITVTNNGPALAENTIMTDALKAGTAFAALQTPTGGGWTCTTPAVGASGTISCSGGDRASGDVSVFTLTLNVNAGVVAGTSICNTAYARSEIVDTTLGNQSSWCSIKLGDLVVDRSDDANVTTCSDAANDCTLRGAINKANSLNADHIVIRFDPAVTQIPIGSSLPTITARGTIISGTLGLPRLDGAGMASGDVISINADEVAINGLSIVNAPAGTADIVVGSGLGTQITNNYLGTLPEAAGATNCTPGGVSRNGGYGVYVDGSVSGSFDTPALWMSGNRVACHSDSGVYLAGADGAIIGRTPTGASGRNYIGTNSTGATLPNGVGVGLIANGTNGARDHVIANNTIANNGETGIKLVGTNTNDSDSTSTNVITGNLILHNGQTTGLGGVYLNNGAFFNAIGGRSAGDANVIEGNVGNGISVIDSNANGILGNHIGNQHGYGNNTGHGIYIGNGASNGVGRFLLQDRGNVIGGNNGDGVQLYGSGATQNSIFNNTIGLNITATAKLANNWSGVAVLGGASDNSIAGNLIAGNDTGLYIAGFGTQNNVVSGNAIGTNWSSAGGLGNTNQGVWLHGGAGSNTIGPAGSSGGNLISGNGGPGVLIDGSGTTYNTVRGNTIGTNRAGTAALPNHDGVQVYQLAASTLITSNLISGNSGNGVALNNASTTTIEANLIGLNSSGTTPIANTGHGLSVEASTNTYIGQNSDHSAAQFISGNGQHGIYIANSTNNWIGWFNWIGYAADRITPMGNAWAGVMLSGTQNSFLNTTIGYNGHEGIGVVGEASHNTFLPLRIENNNGIPIDLGDDGPTPNDSHPAGAGPNGWINYPVITATQGHAITGTACANCTVLVYRALGNSSGAQWAGGAYANASGIWTKTLSNDLFTNGVFLQACQPDCGTTWFANSSELSPIYRWANTVYLPIILTGYSSSIMPPSPTPTPTGR